MATFPPCNYPAYLIFSISSTESKLLFLSWTEFFLLFFWLLLPCEQAGNPFTIVNTWHETNNSELKNIFEFINKSVSPSGIAEKS